MLSVVIPTLNGAETLPAVLDALAQQRVDLDTELVVVDSGSTDGTVELARGRVDRLITIPTGEFDHGLTRNRGIEASRGDLVVLLVQDAVPASDRLLHELTAPVLSDRRVAGVFARQMPRPDASATAVHYLARWVATSPEGRTMQLDGQPALEALAPMERLVRCAFDNVCSCIRRSVWEAIPFRATPIAEDLAWAKSVLLAGHRLVYAPDAVVVHSHDRPAAYELTRTRELHRQLFELFDLRTIPSISSLTRSILSSIALHVSLEWSHPRHLIRALSLGVAWPLGQYLGARDGIRHSHQRATPSR